MQISSSLFAIDAALATRGAQNAANAANGASGAGFASLLLQQQTQAVPAATTPAPPHMQSPPPVAVASPPSAAAEPPPKQAPPANAMPRKPSTAPTPGRAATKAAPPPTSSQDDGVADSGRPAATESAASADARAVLRGKLRAADGGSMVEDAAAGESDTVPSDADAVTEKQKRGAARGNDGSATDRSLDPLNLNLPLAAPAPAVLPGHSGGGRESTQEAGNGGDALGKKSTASLADARAAPRDATLQADLATTAAPAGPVVDGAFSALLAERHADDSGGTNRGAGIDNSTAPLAANASAFGAAPVAGTVSPTAVDLPTPMNAPDFAHQLGVQVSVLAQDGVQRAELHLNPAEMGPVSIEITLDGTQARVDFGADLAATRHAIETGLPALASALADAGFTLTGGGVSPHAGGGRGDGHGGQQSGGAGNGDRRSASIGATDSATGAPSAVRRRTVSAGGVDLYA